jgi:hypothetical protein
MKILNKYEFPETKVYASDESDSDYLCVRYDKAENVGNKRSASNCPYQIRVRKDWSEFDSRVMLHINEMKSDEYLII